MKVPQLENFPNRKFSNSNAYQLESSPTQELHNSRVAQLEGSPTPEWLNSRVPQLGSPPTKVLQAKPQCSLVGFLEERLCLSEGWTLPSRPQPSLDPVGHRQGPQLMVKHKLALPGTRMYQTLFPAICTKKWGPLCTTMADTLGHLLYFITLHSISSKNVPKRAL